MLRGLTHKEHLLEVQKAHGNDTTRLEQEVNQERLRRAAKQAAAADKSAGKGGGGSGPGGPSGKAAGKGQPRHAGGEKTAAQMEIDKLRARNAKLEAEAAAGRAAVAAGPAGVENVPLDNGEGGTEEEAPDVGMEQDDFRTYQGQFREAEEDYKRWCHILELATKSAFKGIDEPLGVDVHAHSAT